CRPDSPRTRPRARRRSSPSSCSLVESAPRPSPPPSRRGSMCDCSSNRKRGPSLAEKIAPDATVLVIGLGRLGAGAAGQLQRLDREVLATDLDMRLVQKWSERVTHAVQADSTNLEALQQIGAADCQIAVVAIGDVEASVLTVANLVDLKIP